MGQEDIVFFFKKSNRDMHSAKVLFNSYDEQDIDAACFLAQQAIEKALKYILDMLGIQYKDVHDITNLTEKIIMKLPLYIPSLKNKEMELTSWATDARYTHNFVATRESLKEAFIIYDLILNDIEFNLQYRKSEEFNFAYQEIKNKGYKYEKEVIEQMILILEKLNLERPLKRNIYIDIKENLDLIPPKKLDASNITNFFGTK